eukprot:2827748-Rhodomonas_salina.1
MQRMNRMNEPWVTLNTPTSQRGPADAESNRVRVRQSWDPKVRILKSRDPTQIHRSSPVRIQPNMDPTEPGSSPVRGSTHSQQSTPC